MHLQYSGPVLPCGMLASSNLAPPSHEPLPATHILSPLLLPSSPSRRSVVPQIAPHTQFASPQICPFRMITIRIAPGVNPCPSQRYKFPYRTPQASANFSPRRASFLFCPLPLTRTPQTPYTPTDAASDRTFEHTYHLEMGLDCAGTNRIKRREAEIV
jgi:hypothetical protein